MTTDSNQSPSDLPELPESIKHLGEGPLGDSFRRLYAEMVEEFTAEQISQIISGDLGARKARAAADWKAGMEARGWTVVLLDCPTGLSEVEKLQAAARPIRGRHLPEISLLRPDTKTIDQRVKDLLGRKLNLGRQTEAKGSEEAVGSDQFRAFELLRTDEEAAATLRKDREAEDTIPVPSEIWHAVRGVLNIPGLREALVDLAENDGYRSDWYAEDLDFVLEELDADSEKAKAEQKAAEIKSDPIPARPGDLKLSDAVKKLLKKTEELLLVDPLKHSKTDAEARAEGNRVHDLVEKSYRDKGFSSTLADILLGKLDSKEASKPEAKAEAKKPETPKAPESTSSFGSKIGGRVSEIFVNYLRLIDPTDASKPEEHHTGKDLSADFSVQDLVAGYDETKVSDAADYITLRANRFPTLYAQLVELFFTDGFSDWERLVMVLGALDGYEASEDYSTGDAYYISQIRQILKRQR